jgi:hypothetical protein
LHCINEKESIMTYYQDYRIGPGMALSLDARSLARIQVRDGSAWGTLEGDSRDYFVHRGESIALSKPEGMFVVESMDAGSGLTVRVWTHANAAMASVAFGAALAWELKRARRVTARALHALARAIEPLHA